ncbi:MAG: hypothetical protein KDA89_24360, partial [Planctomycetaceae bacterium]|nr:hypothetical protein [Planctomycetaceae bacterium]
ADDQNLFGEGLINTGRNVVNTITLPDLGTLTLPSSPTFLATPALSRPIIDASAGPAVTFGNRNSFGGFIIDNSAGIGLLADTVGDISIRDTLVRNAAGDGIYLLNTTGTISMIDTVIENVTGVGLHIEGGDAAIGYTATSSGVDPSFAHIQNASNEAVWIHNSATTVNMTGSTIDDIGGAGIVISDSAGAATLDNVNIQGPAGTRVITTGAGNTYDLTGNGISVVESTGTYVFRDTIRQATTVSDAPGTSVFLSNLADTSRVNIENLTITSPLGIGVDIEDLAGLVNITQDLNMTFAAGAAGSTQPFFRMANSAATGQVRITGDTIINGILGGNVSGGNGFEFTGNAAGSLFSTSGDTTVQNVGGSGISIVTDAANVTFGSAGNGNLTITDTAQQGILISASDGDILFRNSTFVTRPTAALAGTTMVDINNSTGTIQFNNLQANASTGDVGVLLTNNTGDVTFSTLGITSDGNTALLGTGNRLIRTATGTIDAQNAPAVDIFDSGINITLEQVNSQNSPTFGIRLRETNKDLSNHPIVAKTFTVEGNRTVQTAASGGTILSAAAEGVRLENAGQVSLRSMDLIDNLYGIRVFNSGITTLDDQFLQLFNSNLIQNDIRGIESFNLTELDIRDSTFIDNGDGAAAVLAGVLTRESIYLEYNEVPNDPDTTRFTQYDNPYLVNIERTQFLDNTDDVITILNTPTAIGAHIGVNMVQNRFTMPDLSDIDPTDINETAIEFVWNGPVRMVLDANTFELQGTIFGESQTGMFIDVNSPTDLLELDITNNIIDNTTQPGAIGLDLRTSGPSDSLIDNNAFRFLGLGSLGMRYEMASTTELAISNNVLRFEDEGGTGMFFNRMAGPDTNVLISGNLIQLSDRVTNFGIPTDPPFERGIVFQTISGTINLSGPQNNIIELIPIGGTGPILGDIDIFFSPANPTPSISGQIQVNGQFGP